MAANDNISPSEKFRTIVGTITPKTLKPNRASNTHWWSKKSCQCEKPDGTSDRCDEPNQGLYSRICERESRRRLQYILCIVVLDFCYVAQIAFAAILTALGASQSSFIVITIFGALNVAIAGVLALFKGLGLPMRLRKDWLEFQKLRYYIDDQERMFEMKLYTEFEDEKSGCEKCKCGCSKCGCGGHEESKKNNKSPESDKIKEKNGSSYLEKEIQKIQKMYSDLMATVENNQPDFYSSSPTSGSSRRR